MFSSQTKSIDTMILQEAKAKATKMELTELPFVNTIDDMKVTEAYDAVINAFQRACPSPLPGVYLLSVESLNLRGLVI